MSYVQPNGLALALLVTTITLSVVVTTVFACRCFIRITLRRMGVDDYLMLAAWISNMVHNTIVSYGCFVGMGTKDVHLTPEIKMKGEKYVFLWQFFYMTSVVFIKTSICCALKRIAEKRNYINVLNFLIGLSVLVTVAGLVVILVQCIPIQGFWDPSLQDGCWNPVLPTFFTYLVSVVNVITDFTVAIIPILLFRKMQMQPRLKLYAQLVLGLGILASVASIVRIPYSSAYLTDEDFLFNVGNTILWTVVECSIGIIAGSLPSLRQFLKLLSHKSTSKDESGYNNSHQSNGTELVTIGGGGGASNSRKRRKTPYKGESILNVTVVTRGEDGKVSGDDGSSTHQMIGEHEYIQQGEGTDQDVGPAQPPAE